jgi:signal transduction histidine kinase
MDSAVRLRGRGRERLALAIGLVSALLLVGAALAPFTNPDLAGRAALAQLSGRVADGVVAEWDRILKEPSRYATPAGAEFTWMENRPAPLVRAEPLEIAPALDAGVSAFEALMREAEREEAQAPESALSLVLEALEKKLEPGQRAEGRLRAIQLGVRIGNLAVAREQIEHTESELHGLEARHGVSYLLLSGLAAAPSLDDAGREALGRRLVDLWTSGELALTREREALIESEGTLHLQLVPVKEALRARLGDVCADESLRRRLADELERSQTVALEDYLGTLPPRPEDDAWHSIEEPSGIFAWHRAPPDRSSGCFFAWSDLAEALRSSVDQHGLLPPGFRIDFTGQDSRAGAVVRERTALDRKTSGDRFGFWLRHEDPQAVVRSSSRRLWLLRGGLLLMAGVALAAGFATWRAMRRERNLAWMRTAFVANVSHELRTPLASILLLAENLESGRVSESSRPRYHAAIRREAGRLRRLVDDVLDFSRIERGKELEVRLEDTALAGWMSELKEEVLDWAQRSAVDLGISIGDLPQSAAIDGEALRRAIFNLLDNALLHSGSREISFSARTERASLVLSVADRGRGIPREKKDEVFEPFARLDDGDGAAPGTGLGLAIVREIARAHGGSVLLRDPDAGPGTVFEIAIPVESGEVVPA